MPTRFSSQAQPLRLATLFDSAMHPSRLYGLLMGLAALVLGSACLVVISLYGRTMAELKADLLRTTQLHAREVEHFMQMRLDTAQAIAHMGSSLLAEGSPPLPGIRPLLHPAPERGGYLMQIAGTGEARPEGTLTGLGPIPDDTGTLREMTMALRLLVLQRDVLQRDLATPWVYYTSERRFILMHPATPPSSFFYSDDILTLPFHVLAKPAVNPARDHYLTPPYMDAAGKGWMVTTGAPVYEGDTFRGSLCIDISLLQLRELISPSLRKKARTLLVTSAGELLAESDARMDAPMRPETAHTSEAIRALLTNDHALREEGGQAGGLTVFRAPVGTLGWQVVLTVPAAELMEEALFASLPAGAMLVLLFLCVFLLYILVMALKTNRELSIRDSLTGLHNRRFFDEVISVELARTARGERAFGLLLIDVDRFKEYNDNYGHAEGDMALQHVARVLTMSLRNMVDVACRLGGEEFVIIAHANNAEQLAGMAERIREALQALAIPHIASRTGHLTVSIGGVLLPAGADATADALYRRADTALYRAKNAGRDTYRLDATA